jgi:hypothetical protein
MNSVTAGHRNSSSVCLDNGNTVHPGPKNSDLSDWIMRRGRPIKYPRPPNCPHVDRKEHANGVCYQCSSNINNQRKREKKLEEGGTGVCKQQKLKKNTVLTSQEPSPAKRRRRVSNSTELGIPTHPGGLSGYVELNVGYVFVACFTYNT